jgi:hypothetical protein
MSNIPKEANSRMLKPFLAEVAKIPLVDILSCERKHYRDSNIPNGKGFILVNKKENAMKLLGVSPIKVKGVELKIGKHIDERYRAPDVV